MFYKNDWFTWYYDGVEKGPKTSLDSKFTISIKPTINRKVKSFKDEILLNAALTRDLFSEPFDLLFSGGVDSEVVLRAYQELKIPVNIFIFKYENDYNLPDVTHALKVCKELNVVPKVIDFNLKKFFENEAYDIWRTGYYVNAGRLPHMKMIDYLDNIPIMCDGEPAWSCIDNTWFMEYDEAYYSQTIYYKSIGRPGIADWYQYSPEILVSNMSVPLMKTFLSSPGNYKTFQYAKYHVYKSLWNEIEIRPKYIGFEGNLPPGDVNSKPDFMLDFNKTYLKSKEGAKFYFTREELLNML